ncbi:MAG: HAD family hydrolase [Chloroflexi bacterium]|nr:HAD family hydrolase [Chloroflexota bacterium]
MIDERRPPLRAIVFDLGGTLVQWPDWEEDSPRRWGLAHDHLVAMEGGHWPAREAFVAAMRGAEVEHWRRVETEHWSGPPAGLVLDGFRRLHISPFDAEVMTVLDGYALAVDGWAEVFPDAVASLTALRGRGLKIGLLSNTWWAAAWHNADLAVHGLQPLIDELVYTSDLTHSKPHPAVFREAARRLGVSPEECLMVGDRPIDDIRGAISAGMLAVWRQNNHGHPSPEDFAPSATIAELADLPGLIEERGWV